MSELPILLRLHDGTACEYRKRGGRWEGRLDQRGWLPVSGAYGSEWMEAALDEVLRLSVGRNDYRAKWMASEHERQK